MNLHSVAFIITLLAAAFSGAIEAALQGRNGWTIALYFIGGIIFGGLIGTIAYVIEEDIILENMIERRRKKSPSSRVFTFLYFFTPLLILFIVVRGSIWLTLWSMNKFFP